MKGVSYITDEKNQKRAVVIEFKTIEESYDAVHDFIDVLVAEARRDTEKVSWESAKKQLKRKGKI